jgi:hypothetical protein
MQILAGAARGFWDAWFFPGLRLPTARSDAPEKEKGRGNPGLLRQNDDDA